jgi:hypothetical protein
MTGAVYDRYPFEKLRYADMRRTEGWFLSWLSSYTI